ncbi:hypothetical protein Q31a_16360 [Aureliella helgolandensis]|uniref:Uncharacterized protein n=1 Tax=Aureliella helgolandensis TaxID=2527968 RepID=A0A518G413_9BACT|nr:hypothetical protein Q31a_16360 [Aureliella helgolandensis]
MNSLRIFFLDRDIGGTKESYTVAAVSRGDSRQSHRYGLSNRAEETCLYTGR